jgi:hypothetical protein
LAVVWRPFGESVYTASPRRPGTVVADQKLAFAGCVIGLPAGNGNRLWSSSI